MRRAPYQIVLIDDDVDMHDVVRLVLPAPVYRVRCATTATVGLDLIRAERPDVLLLDIMLSTPSEGLELAASLRADPQLAILPIIFISAAPPEVSLNRLPPGTRLIEKPLEAHELRDALREVLV